MKYCFSALVLRFIFVCIVISSFCDANCQYRASIPSWYGEIELFFPEDKLLQDLLESEPLQRLKHINQYGVVQLVDSSVQNNEPYSRYDHSLGVLYLLRRFQASYREQVSGLLHDVSHTVFSHVSDYLFSDSSAGNTNFHDSLFIPFVKKHGLSDILGRYGLSASDVDPAKEGFTMLERELPDLCADRIDYILQGAVRRGVLSQAEQNEVLDSLLFDEKTAHWYLKNEKAARLLADASIELNSKIFAVAWARMLYIWTAKALNRLVELGEFTVEDVLYNKTDAEVWSAFFENKDTEVRALVNKLKFSWYNVTEVSSPDQADMTFKNLRCRIVNPRVLTAEGWQRLTQIDSKFKERFDKESVRCRYQYAKVKQSTDSDQPDRLQPSH